MNKIEEINKTHFDHKAVQIENLLGVKNETVIASGTCLTLEGEEHAALFHFNRKKWEQMYSDWLDLKKVYTNMDKYHFAGVNYISIYEYHYKDENPEVFSFEVTKCELQGEHG